MNDFNDERIGPAVRILDLTKRFGFKTALNDIDFTLNHGELLAVFGPNGAGKTTLIRILSTLMRPTSGKVTVLGHDLEKEGDSLRRAFGVLTHRPLLFDNLTARENLKFYGQMFALRNLNDRINEILTEVGLIEYRDQQVETFSRGMQQRLAIARAIIHKPHLLLLDEPYTGLDQDGIVFLRQTLKAFLDEGKTAIMTCHDFEFGLELCSKAAIFNRGHLIYYGNPSDLDESFESLYQKCVDSGA
ncbi:MAG: heme ABC exporter ATP-binding protein CcmA [Proteobacteria bacterium]|nr:heme ABC exporter ATP-binding protein CcmA [Pseudomonadota bacterium]